MDLINRLTHCKFKDVNKSIEIWKFKEETLKNLQYLETELNKCETEEEKQSILETDVAYEMPVLDLTYEDFQSCRFNENSITWLSPYEISSIVNHKTE